MSILTINIVADLRKVLNVSRFSRRNQPVLTKTAAQHYVNFLRERYLINSAGGGDWPGLKEETIKRKERRGIAEDPSAILRESDTVLESLGIRTRGQLVYAGFVREKDHPRGPSVNQLVIIHSTTRRIIILPSNNVRRKMAESARKEYNKLISRSK